MTNYAFPQALLDSLVGILVVFFALILLMCIIKIMTAVGDAREKNKSAAAAPAAEAPKAETAPAAPAKPLAPGVAGEVKLYDTEPRTAAMLMAIVADELQTPINELRFISIREIKEEA